VTKCLTEPGRAGRILYRLPSSFDELDARLVTALRNNPRVGLLEVARQLGVARGTVQARLGKLESSGVITGHGPEIDPQALGYTVTAFVLIELAQGRLAEAVKVMDGMPEVLEADGVSGPHDLICRVVGRDTEHLQELINTLLATPAIQRCTSYIVLSRQVPPRTLPLVISTAGAHVRRPRSAHVRTGGSAPVPTRKAN
jgi:DNA-binding Lrp family transcriptional regulator